MVSSAWTAMDQLTTGFLLFSYQFIAGSEMDVPPFIWKTIGFDHVWPIITCKHITYKRHGFLSFVNDVNREWIQRCEINGGYHFSSSISLCGCAWYRVYRIPLNYSHLKRKNMINHRIFELFHAFPPKSSDNPIFNGNFRILKWWYYTI